MPHEEAQVNAGSDRGRPWLDFWLDYHWDPEVEDDPAWLRFEDEARPGNGEP
jgi:hypothetical protein